MPRAVRSLTLPPGLSHSALSQSRPRPRGSSTGKSGVFPTACQRAGSLNAESGRTAVMCSLPNEKPDRGVGLQARNTIPLTRRRDPDQLLDLEFLFHQIGEADALQQLVHPLLEGM